MKVKLGDREVDADNMEFVAAAEPWSKYECSDGTVVEIKLVLSKFLRTNERNPATGERVYVATSTNVMRVTEPEEGKKNALN